MPSRRVVLANGEFYHIFNRSLFRAPIFSLHSDCKHALRTLSYYQYSNPPTRLSYFLTYSLEKQKEVFSKLKTHHPLVEINSYCLMPNHYHLLVKQVSDNGISTFVRLFQNSYTRYFNVRHKRNSYLFEGQFKAVRIENESQFLHVSRYIHLNPYTSYLVKNIPELENYPYSSLPYFLNKTENDIVKIKIILSNFLNIESYKSHVFDQADYQRNLQTIKHLVIE